MYYGVTCADDHVTYVLNTRALVVSTRTASSCVLCDVRRGVQGWRELAPVSAPPALAFALCPRFIVLR